MNHQTRPRSTGIGFDRNDSLLSAEIRSGGILDSEVKQISIPIPESPTPPPFSNFSTAKVVDRFHRLSAGRPSDRLWRPGDLFARWVWCKVLVGRPSRDGRDAVIDFPVGLDHVLVDVGRVLS